MQKVMGTLKLPKIDDLTSHKSQATFNRGIVSATQSPVKVGSQIPSPLGGGSSQDPDLSSTAARRVLSSDKIKSYNDGRDDGFLSSQSAKQGWMLKKMEAQRESLLQQRPQFFGGMNNQSLNTSLQSKKGNLDNIAVSPDGKGFSLRRKLPGDETAASKSMNAGVLKGSSSGKSIYPPELNNTPARKKTIVSNAENILEAVFNSVNGKDETLPKKVFKGTFNRNDRGKPPSLTPLDNIEPQAKADKEDAKVNLDILLSIDEAISEISENAENKDRLISAVKKYLELTDGDEILQTDAIFFDTRMRRNMKSYLMLEKTAALAVLALGTQNDSTKDSSDTSLRNICQYMYSNFLNFIDTIIAKLELLPSFTQLPVFESVKQIPKKKTEVDRSFGLEQINKLLLKTIRDSNLKPSLKKGENSTNLDLLLEKIEFGLILNYFVDLKGMFHDLITKHSINVSLKNNGSAPLEPNAERRKSIKHEKKRSVSGLPGKLAPIEPSPIKVIVDKEAQLPPPVPKPGCEDKPIYSLVLDMDETLIHFEEVAGKGRFFVRPFAEQFLKEMSEIYEITVFTAGVQEYADAVLNILDPNKYITHRLYRHHTTYKPNMMGILKDLSKIGRDLSKTIIVDNAPENFRLQPDNGIPIISWFNDPYDTELSDLAPFLKELVQTQVPDVRKAIRKHREKKRSKKR